LSFTKNKDARSTFSTDSLRLKDKRAQVTAPPTGGWELYMKDGVLTSMDSDGVEAEVAPVPTAAAGTMIQVVQAHKTNQFSVTSGVPVDVTGLSVSITPATINSKVLVTAHVNMSTSGAGGDSYCRLMRGLTSIGNGTSAPIGFFGQTAGQDYFAVHTRSITFLDSPGSISPQVYSIQVWGANTTYVNGRGLDAAFITTSSITLMEIAG